jgi:methanogenic corrinoid protein MtbC1
MTEPAWAAVLAALVNADRRAAERSIEEWVAEHGALGAYSDLLEPALEELGRQWDAGRPMVLAQAYLAAKITEALLVRLAADAPPLAPARGPVVLGNIEDDYHALGRNMVRTFLEASGWRVVDLGNDVLPATFVDAALDSGARVIGASAMMYSSARNIARLRAELDGRGLSGRIQLAVGGAVFVLRPGLVAEVGGDGTARNALTAPALIEALDAKALAAGAPR